MTTTTLKLFPLVALTAVSGVIVAQPAAALPRYIPNYGGCGPTALCAPAPRPTPVPPKKNPGDMRVNMGRPIGWVFR